ncbi:MAG: four-helix bundle copper-binding protein [Telluria sp.]
MQECIDACKHCHETCLRMAMTHCLELGGRHVEPEHLRLMLNCAELCQTAANFMLSRSSVHGAVCGACAEVCTACAESCEQVGDMDECVSACRRCAETCGDMASQYQRHGARGAGAGPSLRQ